ncbi:alpha/beta fold hydrolase [Acinetobacter baumannii]|uniref:alpha/beta fold hydrolase n=1 Tax=Acinetobacter baumannii TaxID=470 RepID=UPI00028EE8A1|nr:alpha/beta hydrolase [Acinetobacter baumannii]EKK08980.1 alpha/beta hydrolase family protein [Acinetobacter baumannii Naval-72]MDC4787007.1 alpha/beta hydrolase [Acinetobacter baumannii]RSF51875.1 alpha/beta hydrolase [Acinetobacter baumannii]RSF60001.1 alpha/beta hydrolase [Acinetobacter baumannii]
MDLTKRIHQYTRGAWTFDVIDSGPIDGPLVVLLHGFPETAHSWEQTSELLHEHQFRTFAIHQRGYSLNARPQSRFHYALSELTEDVVVFIKGLGQPVYLIGHDWGSVIASSVAMKYPQYIQHLTLVSVPHQAAFLKACLSSNQLLKSYYFAVFQLPILPELLFKKMPKLGRNFLKSSGMTEQQIEIFETEFIKENRLTTALNWYRGFFWDKPENPFKAIDVPTLFIWGKHDIAVTEKSAKLNSGYFKNNYKAIFMDASHWIPYQNTPELVQYFLESIHDQA